jgi:hypothetical protein
MKQSTLRNWCVIALMCFVPIGCGTTPEPIIRTVDVLVPVPVSCVPEDFPGAPEYPDESEAQDRAEWLALVLVRAGLGRGLHRVGAATISVLIASANFAPS